MGHTFFARYYATSDPDTGYVCIALNTILCARYNSEWKYNSAAELAPIPTITIHALAIQD